MLTLTCSIACMLERIGFDNALQSGTDCMDQAISCQYSDLEKFTIGSLLRGLVHCSRQSLVSTGWSYL